MDTTNKTKEQLIAEGLLPPNKNDENSKIRRLTREEMIEKGLFPTDNTDASETVSHSSESDIFKKYSDRGQLALSFIQTLLDNGAHSKMGAKNIVDFAFALADGVQERTNTDYLKALAESRLNR